jgi:hypothetical protein
VTVPSAFGSHAAIWIGDVVLTFCSDVFQIEKRHPHLRPSGWRRLTFGNLTVLSALWFGERSFIFLPGPPLDFGPHGLFTFYRCVTG